MAFDTKKEKYAFVQGLRAGARGKKPFAKGAPRTAPKSYPKRDKRNTPYRNKGQTDADWEDFFQTAVNRSYGTKQTASALATKTKPFNQLSKSEQIRATERMKKAEYKRYQDDLFDVDRSLYLGMDKRGK